MTVQFTDRSNEMLEICKLISGVIQQQKQKKTIKICIESNSLLLKFRKNWFDKSHQQRQSYTGLMFVL